MFDKLLDEVKNDKLSYSEAVKIHLIVDRINEIRNSSSENVYEFLLEYIDLSAVKNIPANPFEFVNQI